MPADAQMLTTNEHLHSQLLFGHLGTIRLLKFAELGAQISACQARDSARRVRLEDDWRRQGIGRMPLR